MLPEGARGWEPVAGQRGRDRPPSPTPDAVRREFSWTQLSRTQRHAPCAGAILLTRSRAGMPRREELKYLGGRCSQMRYFSSTNPFQLVIIFHGN